MDNQYFDNIFTQYYSQLCVFAFRYVRNKETAEDIVQDVFCNFIEKYKNIRNQESIRSFLYQSTKNGALNFLKNLNNRHKSIEYDIDEKELNTYIDEFVFNNETSYDYQILAKTINSAISSMPDRQKEVFLLSRKQNLSNREIASALNISIKSVEKHITKSLALIRKTLIDHKLIPLLIIFILSNK